MNKDFPSNSNAGREKRVAGPVVEDKVIVDKKNDGIIMNFVKDTSRSVWSDILKPIAINTLYDMIEGSARGILKPTSRGNNKDRTSYSKQSSPNPSRVSYRSDGFADRVTRPIHQARPEDLLFRSENDVIKILRTMDEVIDRYGHVSLLDFYELIPADMLDAYGIQTSYTDDDYGWRNIRTAAPVADRNGYRIRLPRMVPLR